MERFEQSTHDASGLADNFEFVKGGFLNFSARLGMKPKLVHRNKEASQLELLLGVGTSFEEESGNRRGVWRPRSIWTTESVVDRLRAVLFELRILRFLVFR